MRHFVFSFILLASSQVFASSKTHLICTTADGVYLDVIFSELGEDFEKLTARVSFGEESYNPVDYFNANFPQGALSEALEKKGHINAIVSKDGVGLTGGLRFNSGILNLHYAEHAEAWDAIVALEGMVFTGRCK